MVNEEYRQNKGEEEAMRTHGIIPAAKPMISSVGGSTLQPKLRIGPTNDSYEREADRVADQVMRGPVSSGELSGGPSEAWFK